MTHSTTEVFNRVLGCYKPEDYFSIPHVELLHAFAPGLLDKFWQPDQLCGVYLWRVNNVVIYVGQSTGLKWRIAAHLANMLGKTNLMYEEMNQAYNQGTLALEIVKAHRDELFWLERDLIIKHSSPAMFNVVHNPNEPKYKSGVPNGRQIIRSTEDLHNLISARKEADRLLAIDATSAKVNKYKAHKAYEHLEVVDDSDPLKMPLMRCKHCGHTEKLGKAIQHIVTSRLHKGLLPKDAE